MIISMVPTLYNLDHAQQVLAQLRDSEEEGWQYALEAAGKYVKIRVMDEDLELMGYF